MSDTNDILPPPPLMETASAIAPTLHEHTPTVRANRLAAAPEMPNTAAWNQNNTIPQSEVPPVAQESAPVVTPEPQDTEPVTEYADIAPSIPFDAEVQSNNENENLLESVKEESEDKAVADELDNFIAGTAASSSLSCGTVDQTKEVLENLFSNQEESKEYEDKLLKYQHAFVNLTRNMEFLANSMARAAAATKDVTSVFQPSLDGVTPTGMPNIFSLHKDKKEINLSGRMGYLTMLGALGNIRRVVLWNTGLQLQISAPTMDMLINYQRGLEELSGAYGRAMGLPYYQFANASYIAYTVRELLPKVLVGSNYVESTDWDMLMDHISFQDYSLIMMTLIGLTYPAGVTVNLTCNNPKCNHIEEINCDISKLILIDRHKFTPMAINCLHNSNKLDDEALAKYAKEFNFDRTIKCSYELDNGVKREWSIKLKQCTIGEYVRAAEAYLDEIKTNKLSTERDVSNYVATTNLRMFKPWIAEIRGTISDGGTDSRELVLINGNADEYTERTIDLLLNEFQQYYPFIKQQIEDYIVDTKVSHVALYYPKCVKCGNPTTSGYGGYIPYDAQSGFFTLSRLRVLQTIRRNSMSI